MGKVTRRCRVDGRELFVVDDVLEPDPLVRLFRVVDASEFIRHEVAMPSSAVHRHWSVDFDASDFTALEYYPPIKGHVDELFPGEEHRIARVYCNCCTFGQVLIPHQDCGPDDLDVTAILYLNPEWQDDWRGETLFFDHHADAQLAVTPRPGRLVLFRGCIPHVGTPPSRLCHEARLTFAIKFESRTREA